MAQSLRIRAPSPVELAASSICSDHILHQVWCSQNTYREHKTIFHEGIPIIIISTYHTSE